MNEKKMVSIITPSYNQGRFIRETIESVLSQDYENIEYIIVDGGSTDNTMEIVKEYEGRLKYISEKDEGQSDAINKGFKMARGEIVAWLNSDDYYEPCCISNAMRAFEEEPELGLVYGDGYIFDENTGEKSVFMETQDLDLWKLLNYSDFIMQPTTFFRKKCLEEVGYLDKKLNWVMDWDLWIRLSLHYKVRYIPQMFATTREYGETKTSTGGVKRIEEIEKMLSRHGGKDIHFAVDNYRRAMEGSGTIWKRFINAVYGTKNEVVEMPICHQDGWLGKRFVMIIPPRTYSGKVKVRFEIMGAITLPMVLSVFRDGKLTNQHVYKSYGNFEIEIDDINTEKKSEQVEFIMDRFIVEQGTGRLLSIRLKEVLIGEECYLSIV